MQKNAELTPKQKVERENECKQRIKQLESKTDSQQTKSINDYKLLWKQHLNGTEKLAYHSFLKNKTHPEDLCMRCCNANQIILEEGVEATPSIDVCSRINAYYEIEGDRNLQILKMS